MTTNELTRIFKNNIEFGLIDIKLHAYNRLIERRKLKSMLIEGIKSGYISKVSRDGFHFIGLPSNLHKSNFN